MKTLDALHSAMAEVTANSEKLELDYASAGNLMEKRKLDEAIIAWRSLLAAAPNYKDAPARLAATLMARAIRNSFSAFVVSPAVE